MKYLDHVVIYSNTCYNIWKHTVLFNHFRDASLTLNLSKCEFGKATIVYLGRQTGQGRVRPVAVKVQVIDDFPVPRIKRFYINFWVYVVFIADFAEIFQMCLVLVLNLSVL